MIGVLLSVLSSTAFAQPAPRSRPASPPRNGAAAGAQAPLDRRVFPFFPLQAAWTSGTGVPPAAPVATDGVRVFVPFSSGEMGVFSLATGAYLFSRPVVCKLALVVADGRLYVTGDRVVDGLKVEDALPLWKAPLPAPAAFAPVAGGGWVFVALGDGSVVALRGDTGAHVWTAPVGSPAAAPIVEGDRLYAAATGGAVQALTVSDGKPIWRAALDSDPTAVAATAGHVFVATSGRWLYALDAGRGQVRWRFRIQGSAIGLTVDEDRVVAVMLDQSVRAFKIGSGAQAWRQELSFRPAGGPVVTGQSVLVTGYGPQLRAIDRKSGANQGLYAIPLPVDASGISLETLSTGPLVSTGATLFDDLVLLVTQHGLLHAARRAFDPPATPISVLPGTVVAVPEPPPGWVAPAEPPAAPTETTPATTTPATTPPAGSKPPAPATPTPPAGPTPTPPTPTPPPGGDTPPRTPPTPPAR